MDLITDGEHARKARPGIDASCQTQEPPLPLQYPANLIFAQNMLAISLSQLQRVDLTITQLRFHLREQELRAATAALLSNQASLGFTAARVAAALNPGAPAAEAAVAAVVAAPPAADAAAAPEGDAAVPAAAEGGGVGAPFEHLWVHRRRLAAAVKIAFVMVLLEVRTGWFFVYFFAVFLYIGGIFDPIIDWFQRRPARVTLEQQLTALRNRQRAEPEQAQQPAADASSATEGANANAASAAASSGDTSAGSSGSADASGAAAASGSDEAGATGALGQPTEEGGATDAGAAPAENVEPQLPYWHRFIYQLVVMFFMTLLPWWNPDPRYL